jgi:gamma-glutamyltranspeptidase/glutathione hydrolase
VAVLALAACESGERQRKEAVIGSVEGFAGAVAADEPRAALAARDVLAAGGGAADAAVALYFTLAVTLPSRAGLGGGGVCIVHDPEGERPTVLDFVPRAAADGSHGLPGNVRGMAVLHARYGLLQWSDVLGPATELARAAPISRALAQDLAAAGPTLLDNAEMRRIFVRADGGIADAGDSLEQFDLAGTLNQIRRDGGGVFYTGPLALRVAQSAQDFGVPFSGDSLRAVQAEARDALTVNVGERAAYFPAPPAAGGMVEAQLLAMLLQGSDAGAAWPHFFAEMSKRALSDSADAAASADLLSPGHIRELMQTYDPAAATPLAPSGPLTSHVQAPWASGFVVIDSGGMAVACEVTMNGLFGGRRMIPGTGIIPAAAPAENAFLVGPMLAVNPGRGTVDFAGAASGGAAGTTALARVFFESVRLGETLGAAVAEERLVPELAARRLLVEDDLGAAEMDALARRGHAVEATASLGRVNAVWCPGGLPDEPESCQAHSDPRGDGLGILQGE